MTKAIYEAPVLRKHGSVESLTQAAACPGNLDGTYPAGTPSTNPICS
ncbi:MAG: lasso RiPP family leader peptide-containing protein [Pseudomonadota bacterium]